MKMLPWQIYLNYHLFYFYVFMVLGLVNYNSATYNI